RSECPWNASATAPVRSTSSPESDHPRDQPKGVLVIIGSKHGLADGKEGIGMRNNVGRRRGLWMLILLLAGANLAAGSDLRLVEAIKKRDTTSVPILLKQQVDVNTPQPDGATALHWAAHWN